MVIGFLPRFSRSQYSEFIFSFLWCCGLFFGALFSSECSNLFSFWMRTMDPSGVSIVWLFTALFLPFLFSAVAVYLHQSWLLFLLAFIKAFIFGLCLCGVASVCGSAGWIICVLLFFSESSLFPVLFFCRNGTRFPLPVRSASLPCFVSAFSVFYRFYRGSPGEKTLLFPAHKSIDMFQSA